MGDRASNATALDGTPRLVPRRRVPANVRLVGEERIEGELYVAIHGPGGPPETPLERLNEESETYFPIAVGNRHLLVRKSQILAVGLPAEAPRPDITCPEDGGEEEPVKDLWVEIRLVHGPPISRKISVPQERSGRRALDYRNTERPRFFLLSRENGTTAINDEHVLSVAEIPPGAE